MHLPKQLLDVEPTPLLSNPFIQGTQTHDAYEQCVILEGKEEWDQFADFSEDAMADLSPKTVARVLGHGLRLSPNNTGRDALASKILGCKKAPELTCDPELLAGLAHLYVYGLIRLFYNSKGPTHCALPDRKPQFPGFPGFDRSLEPAVENPERFGQTPMVVTTPQLRKRVLLRDNGQCAFTGRYDTELWRTSGFGSLPEGATRTDLTYTVHIVSQSLTSKIGGLSANARKHFEWASTAAAVLERFGGFSTTDVLGSDSGDNLNCPANAFTANILPQGLFDALQLWLIPATDAHGSTVPDTYTVELIHGPRLKWILDCKPMVSFHKATLDDNSDTNGGEKTVTVPPPSPQLLALHAACAQVAHMSGAWRHLYEIFNDWDVEDMPSGEARPDPATILARKLKALEIVPVV